MIKRFRYRVAGWIVGYLFTRAERQHFYTDLRLILDAENDNDPQPPAAGQTAAHV
jgi:hypothetical protein